MQSFSLSQDTIGYTCTCLSKIEDPSTKADHGYVKQAKKLRSELQHLVSSVAKTSNVSVSSEIMSELFRSLLPFLETNLCLLSSLRAFWSLPILFCANQPM